MHPSVAELGITDMEVAKVRFERAFRVSADDAAETILRGVQKNARRVLIGNDARMLDLFQRLLPGTYHGLLARVARYTMAKERRNAPAAPRKPAPSPR